jgi:hypothetical protein
MSNNSWAWTLALVGLTAFRQETYFKEPEKKKWLPAWELTARQEEFDLGPGKDPLKRTQSRLRLRWDFGEEGGPWSFRLQSSHRAASDGNRNSLARFDNEMPNGTNLDLADFSLRFIRARGGVEGRGGLLENGLISTEALWDPDLRLIGIGGRAFWRTENGAIEELGIRLQAGEVRLPAGGRVTLRAAQAVFRASFDPVEIKVFGGPWSLEARQEDAARFRRQNPPGPGVSYLDPQFQLNAYGLGIASEAGLPFEVLATRQMNRDTKDRGEEFQGWLGPRSRVWRPRLGYIRQRLGATGALASVNGDLWWFHALADGQRYVVTLPLPARWEVSLSHVEQTRRGSAFPIKRSWVELKKRF